MTKLERAKRQELLFWMSYLDVAFDIINDRYKGGDGFCEEYHRNTTVESQCNECPIFKLEGDWCPGVEAGKLNTISDIMAVLVYVHGF